MKHKKFKLIFTFLVFGTLVFGTFTSLPFFSNNFQSKNVTNVNNENTTTHEDAVVNENVGMDFVTTFSSQTNSKEVANDVGLPAAEEYYAGITSDGSLYMWGDNTYGQLGIGSNEVVSSDSPVEIYDSVDGWLYGDTEGTNYTGSGIADIFLGTRTSLVLMNDGSVYDWGYNADYRLGLGTSIVADYESQPKLIFCGLVPGEDNFNDMFNFYIEHDLTMGYLGMMPYYRVSDPTLIDPNNLNFKNRPLGFLYLEQDLPLTNSNLYSCRNADNGKVSSIYIDTNQVTGFWCQSGAYYSATEGKLNSNGNNYYSYSLAYDASILAKSDEIADYGDSADIGVNGIIASSENSNWINSPNQSELLDTKVQFQLSIVGESSTDSKVYDAELIDILDSNSKVYRVTGLTQFTDYKIEKIIITDSNGKVSNQIDGFTTFSTIDSPPEIDDIFVTSSDSIAGTATITMIISNLNDVDPNFLYFMIDNNLFYSSYEGNSGNEYYYTLYGFDAFYKYQGIQVKWLNFNGIYQTIYSSDDFFIYLDPYKGKPIESFKKNLSVLSIVFLILLFIFLGIIIAMLTIKNEKIIDEEWIELNWEYKKRFKWFIWIFPNTRREQLIRNYKGSMCMVKGNNNGSIIFNAYALEDHNYYSDINKPLSEVEIKMYENELMLDYEKNQSLLEKNQNPLEKNQKWFSVFKKRDSKKDKSNSNNDNKNENFGYEEFEVAISDLKKQYSKENTNSNSDFKKNDDLKISDEERKEIKAKQSAKLQQNEIEQKEILADFKDLNDKLIALKKEETQRYIKLFTTNEEFLEKKLSENDLKELQNSKEWKDGHKIDGDYNGEAKIIKILRSDLNLDGHSLERIEEKIILIKKERENDAVITICSLNKKNLNAIKNNKKLF